MIDIPQVSKEAIKRSGLLLMEGLSPSDFWEVHSDCEVEKVSTGRVEGSGFIHAVDLYEVPAFERNFKCEQHGVTSEVFWDIGG